MIYTQAVDKSDLVVQKIKEFLTSKNIQFEYLEHEPTPTSADSARVRGTKPEEGAKALIIRLSKTDINIMLVLPGNLKIDSKKVKAVVGKDFSFEDPAVIFERYGIMIGGVPPFGNLLENEIKMLIEEKLFLNDTISFNCGKKTASIIMKASDYKNIIKDIATIGNFSKE